MAAGLVGALLVGALSPSATAASQAAPHELLTARAPQSRAVQEIGSTVATGPWTRLGVNAEDPAAETDPAAGLHQEAWTGAGDRCAADDPYRSAICFVRGAQPDQEAERTILVLGNSHTVQLTAALHEVADRRPGWVVRTQAAPACTFSGPETRTDECRHVWEIGTRYILEQQPDLVVVMATRSSAGGSENLYPGLVDWAEQIRTRTTTRVLVVRDSPRFGFDMGRCAREQGTGSAGCAARVDNSALDDHRIDLERAGAIYLDLNARLCPDGVCRPVIGGVWTYMDDNHLSADIWRTLAAPLSEYLHTRVGWWPGNPYIGEKLPLPHTTIDPVI